MIKSHEVACSIVLDSKLLQVLLVISYLMHVVGRLSYQFDIDCAVMRTNLLHNFENLISLLTFTTSQSDQDIVTF